MKNIYLWNPNRGIYLNRNDTLFWVNNFDEFFNKFYDRN